MSKKGIMSIEAMIIFISVVLIAAVSAGMLIRTSGLMQQRAISVSDEARERIITGIEIINMVAQSDLENQNLNDIELLVRLKSGSNPVQLKDVNLMITTPSYSESATLSHFSMTPLYDDIDISSVPNSNMSTWLTIPNIEVENVRDIGVTTERVRLLINGSGDNEVLEFDLSYASNKIDADLNRLGFSVPPEIFQIDLGLDLSNISSGVLIDITDAPIKHSLSGDVYGYVTIKGNATVNNSLSGVSAIVTSYPTSKLCDFENLIPNKRFCVITRVGLNDDTRMEKGELYSFRFKVKDHQAIATEQLFEIRLIPKGGSIESVQVVTPSVLVLSTTNLWG